MRVTYATFTFRLCNTEKTTTEPPCIRPIEADISNLFSGAHPVPYIATYDYKNSHVSGGVTAWTGDVRPIRRYGLSDCSACLQQVGKLIYSSCGNAVGARYQVSDCFMEYENTSF